MDALWADFFAPAFWVVAQIIGVNITPSATMPSSSRLPAGMPPPRQRFWGMILGAGVAVLLRVLFTPVAEAMGYAWLKLIGGLCCCGSR